MNLDKQNGSGEKEKITYAALLNKVVDELKSGKLASNLSFEEEEREMLRDLHLLTMKPHLYIINLHEDELSTGIDTQKYAQDLGLDSHDKIIPICAKVEEELGDFGQKEAAEYLKTLGLDETGLNTLITKAYDTLSIITFFTSGPKETRAWTVKKGALAPASAGKIHTDFEKGFIKAEVVDWKDLHKSGGEGKAREKGLLRIEGKEYQVKDGDVMHFRFST